MVEKRQCLAIENPMVASEWHPTKNGELTPYDVTAGSNKKIWWYKKHLDERTGKEFEFEWQATIYSRCNGNGCPFVSGKALWRGYNDLETVCKELASQWHPTKNGKLRPCDVMPHCGKKVWWIYTYTCEKTGVHNFEWQATIDSRMRDSGCPFLTNGKVWPGFNDFATLYPELLNEWSKTKNSEVNPHYVFARSDKMVWWTLEYDCPKTGHHTFIWQDTIKNRSNGAKCPFLIGKKVWKGFNDLATLRPDVAKEWHTTKNKDLTPYDVTLGSEKNVWWECDVVHPITKEKIKLEWKAKICNRVKGDGCPYLTGSRLLVGFNDLQTLNPILSSEWAYEKNGKLKPIDVTQFSSRKVWWKCGHGHYWQAKIGNRSSLKTGCPQCSKGSQTSFPECATYYYLQKVFPDATHNNREMIGLELDIYIPSVNVAIEYDGGAWHQDLEKDLKKNRLCQENGIKLFRIRERDAVKMKEDEYCQILEVSYGNEKDLIEAIQKIISNLDKNASQDINISRDMAEIEKLTIHNEIENSLAKLYPEIAKEWHKTKNGCLKPEHVAAKSSKKVWWSQIHKHPITGEEIELEWQAKISDRVKGCGCPYLKGRKLLAGFNDLQTLNEQLAIEWNFSKNKELFKKENADTPDKVTANSHKKVWWKCQKCKHEWRAQISNRNNGQGCPNCYKNKK